jgi:hypothetical protein
MTKSYADQCLERAEKATEGPFYGRIEEIYVGAYRKTVWAIYRGSWERDGYQNKAPIAWFENHGDAISFLRTDVPELARRLKKACEFIIGAGYYDKQTMYAGKRLLDELEAMPEDK